MKMPHLLLVEDDTVIGESVRDGLNEYGYVVTWEQRGDAAQEILQAHNFNLIILDFTLPKVTGLTLIQSMRSNQDNTPIVMITANINEAEIRQCHAAGVDVLFDKPFELDDLLLCIEKLLAADR